MTALRHMATLSEESADGEFGTRCQRVFPLDLIDDETLGAMGCWLEPGRQTEPDQHDQREMVFVTGGRGTLVSGAESTPLRAGDVVFIEKNHEHVVHCTDEALTWFSVYWPLKETR
ncbi:cupin domain-containing protein [Actinoplanes flavus]|uniref:Cupin domain-containing protein n=1 Tax=Actinoplanes flavus TaxID=2820290 RepID=A0ABS3UH50_9ACTN|nr:cupin domain-containing protein [Actinoplanes flavus]MBO3738102.1 cupin domain-containing protein [Actinoplanes flavus]